MNSNEIYSGAEMVLKKYEENLLKDGLESKERKDLADQYQSLLSSYIDAESNATTARKNTDENERAKRDRILKYVDIGVKAAGAIGSAVILIVFTQKSFEFDMSGVHTSYTAKECMRNALRFFTKKF